MVRYSKKEALAQLITALTFSFAALIFICLAYLEKGPFYRVMAALWTITAGSHWGVIAYRSRIRRR